MLLVTRRHSTSDRSAQPYLASEPRRERRQLVAREDVATAIQKNKRLVATATIPNES